MIELEGKDTAYETGASDSDQGIIAIYDVWALSTNLKENLDRIGTATKARVVMPDYYRGQAWTAERA